MFRELLGLTVLATGPLVSAPVVALAEESSEPEEALASPVGSPGVTPAATMVEPDPPPNDAAVAITFAPEFGVSVLPASEALDAALRDAGRSELGTLSGAALGSRFGLQVYGLSLSATIGAVFIGEDDAPNATYLERDWLLGEASYDVFAPSWLTLSPIVGAGVHVSRLCVSGASTAPPEGGIFNQVLTNPGAETCMEQRQAVAKLGFVGGVAAPLAVDGAVVLATFDLRPSITWALGDGRYEILEQEQVPAFDGPGSSRTAFSFVLDVGFVFGFGQR